MPLRDHFHAPLVARRSWSAVHGMWPAMLVIDLNRRLPPRYLAEPQVHLGEVIEHEYEARVFDLDEGRRLVAAVEIVSPSNKDRPESRKAFVSKCAAMLREGVCVVIVDIVTIRRFNLSAELLGFLGRADTGGDGPIYASSLRRARFQETWRLEAWIHDLEVGESLPTLPLWLAEDLAVPLEIESTYEETCLALRISEE